MDDAHLRTHAEALVLRKLLLQVADLVSQREEGDISEEEFLTGVKERSEVYRQLELPLLREIIEKLERL